MNVVGRVSSFITQGMYSVATPFHPFGGAVDIIVVKQQDGSFRSTPWYVRFGKFQGVLKGAEKVVRIEVNGVEANFNMYLDNSGEAYFVREVDLREEDGEGIKEGRTTKTGSDYGDEEDDESSFKNGGNGDEVRFDLGMEKLKKIESDSGHVFYEFQDEQSSSLDGSIEFSEYGSSRYDTLDSVEHALESQDSNSEVVLVSVDGHILTAPLSSSERDGENVQLSTPQFHLGPGGGTADYSPGKASWTPDYLDDLNASDRELLVHEQEDQKSTDIYIENNSRKSLSLLEKDDVFQSCLELPELAVQYMNGRPDHQTTEDSKEKFDRSSSYKHDTENGNHDELRIEDEPLDSGNRIRNSFPNSQVEAVMYERNTYNKEKESKSVTKLEISLCGNMIQPGMGLQAAEAAFDASRISPEEFRNSGSSIVKNENLIVRLQGKYLPWSKAAHIVLGKVAFGFDLPVDSKDSIPVEKDTPEVKEEASGMNSTSSRRWRLWPIPFRRVKTLERTFSNSSNEEVFVDSESLSSPRQPTATTPTASAISRPPYKQLVRTNVPTNDQISSLNLKEGQNIVNFVFCTRVLGSQKVEAHIYVWKWNTRIVVSDVDGTITKSDVLGQFMPLVGKDWTHSGIARLFSAIKENGYQLLFLSARAIVQAYLTKSFLFNLKQDGKSLPNGPVVISPDGLFPSLYREVIRRAPHEFKIACLEDIKALFPADYNPFYAGFGNRDTDELSYRKVGIPKGKIFIINPKGEVAINHRVDVKSYTSFHTLVNDMFPPTSLVEQEDYNSWNYWKMPLPDIDKL
ncbi:phosphatidate phosphatase PAH1 [Andrographis paniculata]|uniref:phosphatidate phosphatase PAH1 n=1 Tax=Andrographis paniculata TaxID=175694 RepID=UPI0021E6EEAC|nr:phosphatidate phosphatase PAH1 [Andrographis paniculata]XP_051130373.1 phosphatidate phosphatase PAH1 [Andrographis paniculata]